MHGLDMLGHVAWVLSHLHYIVVGAVLVAVCVVFYDLYRGE